MIRKLTILLIILLNTLKIFAQKEIVGRVISKHTGDPLSGVSILEKGTKNSTSTKLDGTFLLKATNSGLILIVSSIGFYPKEIKLKGSDTIKVKLKEACNIDWFDNNKIGVYANSGIINTPIGGEIELFSPYFFIGTIIKTTFSYQTDFDKNKFSNAEISIPHLIANCNFNADIRAYYHNVAFNDELSSKTFSIQTDLNFQNLKLITGFSNANFTNPRKQKYISSTGPLLGAGTWFGRRSRFFVQGKISYYKSLLEYQTEINKSFWKLNAFIKFYKIDTFKELTVGVGKNFYYRIKKDKT